MNFTVEADESARKQHFAWHASEGPAMDDLVGVRCLLRGKAVTVKGMSGNPGDIRCWVRFEKGDTTCWANLVDLTPIEEAVDDDT